MFTVPNLFLMSFLQAASVLQMQYMKSWLEAVVLSDIKKIKSQEDYR